MKMYRQFAQDAIENRDAGKLPDSVPILALGGDRPWRPHIVRRLSSVSDNVRGGSLPKCGRFLAEKQLGLLMEALRDFCKH
ncbi:hypothetical protein [Paraburkholderia sp. RL17-347-BIC-D]|uniref:hypothetical protein n=1 Tax=Paraburkholderia sp. RL17-347-BIC-D TaxID=3031632 RepID=UPI0038B70C53